MDYPITNSTIRILKFILKNQNCTFTEIKQKFGKDADEMELVNLGLMGYIVCTRPDNRPTKFQDGNWVVSSGDRFWASPKTTQLIENRRREWLQWVIPNVISGLALVLSILTLWLSLQPQVTEVRILP